MRSIPPMLRADHFARNALASTAASLRIGVAQALAAWPVLMGRVIFYLLILIVLSALWDKVADEQVAPLAKNLPPGGLPVYICVTEWVLMSVVAIDQRLEDDIRRGALEPYLLRPKPYLLQRVAPAMGEMLVRLATLGTAGLLVMAISGQPMPAPFAWPAVLLLGIFGCITGLLLYVLVGLLAFWLRRVMPAMLIVQKLSFLLGGLLAPISLYPDWLFGFAAATPFGAHLYWAGAQVLAPSARLFLIGLAWKILWIAILAALCALVWRIGLRKLLREGV